MNSQTWEAGSSPADTSMDTLDDVDIDFALAGQGGTCVLLTAPPGTALLAAREIVSRSGLRRTGIDVVDCHTADPVALRTALCEHLLAPVRPDSSALLIREVQALATADQALLANLLETLKYGSANRRRVFASSSVSLFDRVKAGTFDERLFYRLNIIHVIVDTADEH